MRLTAVHTMISLRAGRISWTAFSDATARLALRRRLVAGPAADVAVGHRLEALDHIAFVIETVAEQVGEEGVAGKRVDRLRGAVPFVPVEGSGGDALPGTSTRHPLTARPSLSATCRHGRATQW